MNIIILLRVHLCYERIRSVSINYICNAHPRSTNIIKIHCNNPINHLLDAGRARRRMHTDENYMKIHIPANIHTLAIRFRISNRHIHEYKHKNTHTLKVAHIHSHNFCVSSIFARVCSILVGGGHISNE